MLKRQHGCRSQHGYLLPSEITLNAARIATSVLRIQRRRTTAGPSGPVFHVSFDVRNRQVLVLRLFELKRILNRAASFHPL